MNIDWYSARNATINPTWYQVYTPSNNSLYQPMRNVDITRRHEPETK